MNKNYDFLLNLEGSEKFLNENSEKIFGQKQVIKILDFKRSYTYNPDSYNVFYHLMVGTQEKEIRISASKALDKKTDFLILDYYFQHGFNEGNILVNKPLAYFADFNLYVYENMPGEILIERLNEKFEDLLLKVEMSGRALKKVHELPKPDFPLWDTNRFFIFKEREKIAMAKYYPNLFNKLDSIIDEIKIKSEFSKATNVCHGDFQPSNLLFDQDKIYILDLGLSCLADPEFDVAIFINQLTIMLRRFGNFEHLEALKNIFLKNYGEINAEKMDLYSILINLRILGVFCMADDREDNPRFIPFVYESLKENFTHLGINID